MTDLYVFSRAEITGDQEPKELKEPDEPMDGGEPADQGPEGPEENVVIGGLSITGLLKKKSNALSDSKLYSFFDNLAVPIGLTCYKDALLVDEGSIHGQKEEFNDGVIKADLFDRLFNMSSMNLTRGKARKTRKKIPQ